MWSGVSIEDVRNAAVDILVDNQKYRRYKCIWYKAEKAIMGKLGGSCIGCIFSSKDSGCWCLDMHDRLCESSQRVNNDCIVWKKMSTNEINDVLVMLEKGQIH
jgi:hypothetical protein